MDKISIENKDDYKEDVNGALLLILIDKINEIVDWINAQ